MAKRANGEGSCYQLPDGRWRAVDADRTVYRIGKTQREAIKKRDDELSRRGVSVGRIRAHTPLSEFLTAWLNSKAASVRATTLRTYRGTLSTHVNPVIGTVPLGRVTTAHVQDVIDKAAAKGRASATLRHIGRLLEDAFAQAISWKLMGLNPCTGIILPKKQKALVTPVYDELLSSFMAVAAKDRLEALWLFLVGFGPRRGEALAISLDSVKLWQDGDRWRAAITITHTLQRFDGELRFMVTKSAAGMRTVELPTFAVDALRRRLDQREAERKAAGAGWVETGLLFGTKRGTPLEPRNVTRRFKQLLAKVGGTGKLHALRHTTASILLREGVDVKAVQHIMGHATASMTLDQYGHLMPGRSSVGADAMDGALSKLR